jgi:DNA-binding NarL/FixJ family response regulator
MLTAYSDDGYVEKVSTIGVWGFLLKQCSPHVLIEAIEAINAGKKFFAQGFKSENINRIVVELTDRERQVLQLIAEGNPNKLVAMELEISIKTVEKHRQNLMNKLSIHDTAGLTRYAIAEGMIESSGHKSTI